MFSMRMTSPRVTPKTNGAPPSPSPALDLTPSRLDRAASTDVAGVDGSSTDNGAHSSPRPMEGIAEWSTPNNLSMPLEIGRAEFAREAENDSAVANVAEDVAPRSNLQALLDRELEGGSGSGEDLNKGDVLNGDTSTSFGAAEPVAAANAGCTEEEDKGEHQIIEDEVDLDQVNGESIPAAGEIEDEVDLDDGSGRNVQPRETLAPLNLGDGCYPLPKRGRGSFDDYRRTDSMEPLFGARSAEESSLSIEESSVEGAPNAGQAGSSANDEVTNALAMPNLEEDRGADPSSPIIYDMSEQPVSPILSAVNGDAVPTGSPASHATESDIGGDTYFDDPGRKRQQSGERADSTEDDFVHVKLPPRVNRTTLTGHANGGAPFLPHPPSARTDPFPTQTSLPMSPRPQFTHTHSLLDDCSDEEETSYKIVDSPPRQPYSCLPRASAGGEGDSPFSSYFKRPKHIRKRQNSLQSSMSSATQVASNNIQQALLQTRHRRWDCQSAYAGAHAQSNQVFDVSNRVHYVVGKSARLSVSVEAVRAAALASGLWRTVRLVRLPKGLFWPHVQRSEDDEVWELLKMLHSTFPVLDQVDFGGDISRAARRPNEDVTDWRDEILTCIMECLPNIVAIEGFVVDALGTDPSFGKSSEEANARADSLDDRNPSRETDEVNLDGAAEFSTACVDCPEAPMCGLSELVDDEDQAFHTDTSTGALSDKKDPTEGGKEPSISEPYQLSKSAEGTLEVSTNQAPLQSERQTLASKGSLLQEEIPTLSASSSMLSSSGSWGGNGNSGARPPPCPSSASRQRPRIPTKPADRKMAKLKRRVLGLIPTVSMMDDEEDEDSDDSEGNAGSECPTDLL